MNKQMHAWAEVNLDNLAHNYKTLKRMVGNESELMPVVKAQAYGAGSELVAKTLRQCGAKYFAVADLEEARFLRSKGLRGHILNFGLVEKDQLSRLNSLNLVQAVFSMSQLRMMGQWANRKKCRLSIQLKFDTGMGRLGFDPAETLTLIRQLRRFSFLKVDGLFSHFPCADNRKSVLTAQQRKQMRQLAAEFEKHGINLKLIHIENSAGIFSHADPLLNIARPGIATYGLDPFGRFPKKSPLKPVLSLKSKVVMIKTVEKGTGISYGQIFRPKKRTKIATVSIGYADGYNRLLSNKGSVLIKSRRYPIAGRVTMNFIMADIGNNSRIKAGDTVTLIGSDRGKEISMQEIADTLKTITYEVQCNISALVPRIYIKGGKAVKTKKNILI